MITLSPNDQIFLCRDPIDFRKQINGLISLTQSILEQNPYSQKYFAFTNKRNNSVKILHYDGQGYWLHQKRLSKGKFKWPKGDQEKISLSSTELQILLMNGDYLRAQLAGPWKKIA